MPFDGLDEEGGRAEDMFVGVSSESLHKALDKAVDAAGKEHGTWLRVVSISILSVDDPHVGGYKVTVAPGG